MSQQQSFGNTGTPGVADIETLTGNDSLPVTPDPILFNVNVFGSDGIATKRTAAHSLTTYNPYFKQGFIGTIDATPTNIIVFNMGVASGALPAVFTLEGKISAYNSTDNIGAGFFFSGTFRTTGAAGVEIGQNSGNVFKEGIFPAPNMDAADFTLSAVGNSILLKVIGIAGKAIDWQADYLFNMAV